jgi:hypothetical protein
MPWTAPVNPVSGTVITVAYAVSNILDPIRWLRLLGGNADPPGSNYVLTSDSVSAVTWKQHGAAIVGGGGLGYTPVSRLGDTMTGQLRVFRTQGAAAGAFDAAPLVVQSPDAAANPSETAGIGLHRTSASGVYVYHAGAALANLLRFITNTGVTGSFLHTANMGSGSGLDADTLRGCVPSNAAGAASLALNNGMLNATLNAQMLQGLQPQNVAGQIPLNNNAINPGLVAEKLGSGASLFLPGNGNGNIPISNGNVNVNLVAATASNANTVAGKTPTTAPSAGALPLADAAGKLDAWVTPSGGTGAVIPPGLLCYWETATPPSGWVIDTRWDGNIIAMKGGSFSSTLGQTGGGATHDHSFNNQHSHSGAALGVGGTIGGPSSTGSGGGTGATFADGSHSHSAAALDVSGSTDAAQSTSQSVGSISHLPPYVSLNLIRKT